MDARHLLGVEVAADLDGEVVAGPDAGEGDGLGYDVVRSEEKVRQRPVPQNLEDLPDPWVVAAIRR
jgi:hypothetical protein